MTDVNRKITYVNESFEKVTGYRREDVLGKNPHICKKNQEDFMIFTKIWMIFLIKVKSG